MDDGLKNKLKKKEDGDGSEVARKPPKTRGKVDRADDLIGNHSFRANVNTVNASCSDPK